MNKGFEPLDREDAVLHENVDGIPEPHDGSLTKQALGNWSGSTAMTALNGWLYIIHNETLWRVNPNDGSWKPRGKANWSGSTAMTALNGWLYVTQNEGLWRVNPNDGSRTRL